MESISSLKEKQLTQGAGQENKYPQALRAAGELARATLERSFVGNLVKEYRQRSAVKDRIAQIVAKRAQTETMIHDRIQKLVKAHEPRLHERAAERLRAFEGLKVDLNLKVAPNLQNTATVKR